jgi:3-dehydroquinate dehydratase
MARVGIWTPNLPNLNRTRLPRVYGARSFNEIKNTIHAKYDELLSYFIS